MEIKITSKAYSGGDSWEHKRQGVVLVEKEADIEPLYKLLCEQDDYWEGSKNLIKVAPSEIGDVRDLDKMCEYTCKTDIFHPDQLRAKIPFIMHQYHEDYR